MRTRAELVALRQRAGNLRTREVMALLEDQGYALDRTSGGHHIFLRAGAIRPIVVPDRIRTANTVRGIINRLIREQEARDGDG